MTKTAADSLEQHWVRFQFEVAALRPALGPLYNAAFGGRRAHTFYVGSQPPNLVGRATMAPTRDKPNGVPDLFGATSQGAYSARVISVSASSTILMMIDSAVQGFARILGERAGYDMDAGDEIPSPSAAIKASTFIFSAANNVRHVDEWSATAASYLDPTNARDRERRDRQQRSMKPLAAVLGVGLPLVENVAFEAFQHLCAVDDETGSYDRLELHVLRIGQDLIHRAGLADAPIGVTVTDIADISEVRDGVIVSDGISRTAASVDDLSRRFSVRPLAD